MDSKHFGIYLQGDKAVEAAKIFCAGQCFRALIVAGVKIAQVEIVLDNVVEVAYIDNLDDVDKAIAALAHNGFTGAPYVVYTETVTGCYAEQHDTGRTGIIGQTTDPAEQQDATDTTTAKKNAQNSPEKVEGKKEEKEMKHYYIKRGDFANVYSLEYTTSAAQDAAAVAAGYERITRREALSLCARERDRRQYDGAFSGYADAQIWPFGVDRERAMQFPGYMRGYIVE